MKQISILFFLIVFLNVIAQSVLAAQPTFSCDAASHTAEQAICKNEKLIALDNLMAKIYQESLRASKNLGSGAKADTAKLKATQRGWVSGRNDCWKEQDDKKIEQCIEDQYRQRISMLQLQYRLVKVDKVERFVCPENGEIILSYYDTSIIPGVVLEYGDSVQLYLSAPSQDKESLLMYEGEFGKSFRIEKEAGFFTLDQFKPELKCQLTKTAKE
jgi:uncharacterized protein